MNSTRRSVLLKFNTFLIIALILHSSASYCQKKYCTQHFTAENGLPQNSIKSIAVDDDGFMWLATEDGLTRFDGRNFKVFGNKSTGADSKRVVSIFPGVRNRDRHHQLAVAYAHFYSDDISKISNGHAGRSGKDTGNIQSKIQTLQDMDICYVRGLPERWPRTISPEVPTLLTDSYDEGNFFLCDRYKVSYYHQWKKHYEVANDAPERFNYFMLGGRLYYFDGEQRITQIFNNQCYTFHLKGDITWIQGFQTQKSRIKIYWNDNSDQAFLYFNGKLFDFVTERDGSLSTHLLISDFDLVRESIDVIYYDREYKKVFLGSSTNGLFVVSLPQFETIRVSGTDRPNIFYGQIPYDGNSILTSTGIIAGKNPVTGAYIDRRLPEVERLRTDDKRMIVKDQQGNVWIKSGNSLIRIDPYNQVIGEWKFQNGVKDIIQKNESEFWVGVYDLGIFKIDVRDSSSAAKYVGGELARHITCICRKNAAELWVGTVKGLYTVHLEDGHTSLVSGTSGLNIKSVQSYDGNKFWVTALDKGLMLINGDKQIVTFPMDKRGFLASAHYAFDDKKGFLWIPTNRGLFQMKISDLIWYAGRQMEIAAQGNTTHSDSKDALFYAYHDMNEGFNTNEFNGGCNSCGLTLENGYASLPSLDGLVWFKPERISAFEPKEKFILDGVYVDGQIVDTTGDTLLLPLKPENIKLYFSTGYFGNSSSLKISYSLGRVGEHLRTLKWLDLGDENGDIIVQYSSLPSGTYELYIRKQGGFGPNNFIGKKLTIIVPQPWYENRWIYFLLAMIGLTIGFALLKIRFKKIKMRNQLLEMQVSARTDELRQTLLTLEATQSDLLHQFHLQSRLLTSMAHDLRSPLSAAIIVTSEVGRLISSQKYNQAAVLNQQVEDAVGLIKQSLEELLAYIKVQVYSKEVKIERVVLADLIDTSFDLYAKITRMNANSFENNVPKGVTVLTNPQLLNIIIRNLTDNANKFTENGTISANWAQDTASLTIRDTGRGLPPALIEWFTQTGPAPSLEKFNGLGLIIVKELAPFAMIRLELKTNSGSTQITMHFSDFEISNLTR